MSRMHSLLNIVAFLNTLSAGTASMNLRFLIVLLLNLLCGQEMEGGEEILKFKLYFISLHLF